MNKYGYILAAVSANIISTPAVASDINQNLEGDYIKLASINPIIDFDGNFVMQNKLETSTPINPSDPTDPDNPINISCVARGYDVTGGCAADGNCVPDYCPENNAFMKCTCFCAVNACTEDGYIEQTCTKYQVSEDCPMLPTLGFTKCTEMDNAQKCIVDDYLKTVDDCSVYNKAERCSYDNLYLKCVPMTNAEKCEKDGYYLSSCSSGQTLTTKCPYGSENLYKTCELTNCSSSYVTSCSSGYHLNTSDSCTDTFGTKYKCVADTCDGYTQTTPCSPVSGYTQDTCLSGTTIKYKCTANTCSGYDQTSPCGSGYTETTCQAGSTTKYKCVANACTGYNLTDCLPTKGYSSIETCQAGSTLKYKCIMNDCEAYPYTSCPAGYEFVDICFEGSAKKYKCTKSGPTGAERCRDEGYTTSSASAPYVVGSTCPYDSSYHYVICNPDTVRGCRNAGFTRPAGSCPMDDDEYRCSCDAEWVKCISN